MSNDIINDPTDTHYECVECKAIVDEETEGGWFSWIADGMVCTSCRESDEQTCSQIKIIEGGESLTVYVGDLFIMNEYGDDEASLTINREYHPTDAWRGYYETKIGGYVPIAEGWTTGGWDDAVARRKAIFNDWAQDLLSGEIVTPFPVIIVTDPTSNVFSTAVSVLAHSAMQFTEFFGEELVETLRDSLR